MPWHLQGGQESAARAGRLQQVMPVIADVVTAVVSMLHVLAERLTNSHACRDNYKTERLWAIAPDGTKVCNHL
jgi:hypothetical protein